MNLSSYRKYLKPMFVILLVILVVLYAFRQDASGLIKIIEKHKNLSILISLIVYTLLGATPIPSEPLTVFSITLYGPLWTVLIATVGNTLAALLEFFVGGNIGDLADFEKRKAKLPFRLGEIPIQSPIFLLLARMLPGLGPKFVSVASGIYRVPLFTYIWTAIVSHLIGAAILVSGGYSLLKLL